MSTEVELLTITSGANTPVKKMKGNNRVIYTRGHTVVIKQGEIKHAKTHVIKQGQLLM